MTSSYTTNKGIEEPANGDYVGNWNLPVNADWNTIDTCFGGIQVLNPTGLSGTVTLTSSTSGTQPYTRTAQWQAPNLVIGTSATGQATLTNNVNYQLPSGIGGVWSIWNNTTGAYTVTFSSAGGGSSVVIPQGYTISVVSDGTNIRPAVNSAAAAFAASSLRLLGSSSGYMGFQSPATGNNTIWTLPGTDGTNGQVMITNGSGVLSWYTLPVVSGYLPLTGGTLTGNLYGTNAGFGSGSITSGSATLAAQSAVFLDSLVTSSVGQYRILSFLSNGLFRWNLIANTELETGSNAGSNFTISRYNDAGTPIDNPITISRATGVVIIQDGLIISTGGLQVTGGFSANSGLQSIVSGSATNGLLAFGSGGNSVLDSATAGTLTINRAAFGSVASSGAWTHSSTFTATGSSPTPTSGIGSFAVKGSGAYGGGIGLLDGTYAWGVWDSGGVLNFGNGTGSGGALTARFTLDGSGNASFGGSITVNGAPGIYLVGNTGIQSNVTNGDVYIAGGNTYNSGAAITFNGPGAGGVMNFYTGSGGTNALAMTINANQTTLFNADAYFNAAYGPTSTLSVGYRGIPQSGGSFKGSNYTAVLSDAGNSIVANASVTLTIPANASVAYPVGTTLTFVNYQTSGNVTISINSDTLYLANTAGTTGSRTLAPLGMATAIKVLSTFWIISGAGLT